MRLLTLSFSLFVLVLLMFTPAQNADAAELTGSFYFEGIIDSGSNCGAIPQVVGPPNFTVDLALNGDISGTVTDTYETYNGVSTPRDAMAFVVFDGYGNPVLAQIWLRQVQGGIPTTAIGWNFQRATQIAGQVAPQARPFIARVYDLDSSNPRPSSIAEIITFPTMTITEPYDPAGDSTACAQLPLVNIYDFIAGLSSIPDITSETGISSSASDLAIYESEDGGGLDCYAINDDGDGVYVGTVTQDMIAEYVANPPEENMFIASFGDNVNVYVLTTGEIQINVGPNEEGKTFVYIFDGIPWTSITTYVIDPPSAE